VKRYIKANWPDLKTLPAPKLVSAWRFLPTTRVPHNWTRLHNVHGTDCNSNQPTVLKLFQGHPGIQRMKSLARSCAYWPGMDHDIENMVRRCSPCASAAKQRSLSNITFVDSSYKTIGAHTHRLRRTISGKTFPYFRGCIFQISRGHASTQHDVTTVTALKQLCAQHGVPETLVSGNGTQFISQEFKEFRTAKAINHILSPP
jgi:transposase InsO family protein